MQSRRVPVSIGFVTVFLLAVSWFILGCEEQSPLSSAGAGGAYVCAPAVGLDDDNLEDILDDFEDDPPDVILIVSGEEDGDDDGDDWEEDDQDGEDDDEDDDGDDDEDGEIIFIWLVDGAEPASFIAALKTDITSAVTQMAGDATDPALSLVDIREEKRAVDGYVEEVTTWSTLYNSLTVTMRVQTITIDSTDMIFAAITGVGSVKAIGDTAMAIIRKIGC